MATRVQRTSTPLKRNRCFISSRVLPVSRSQRPGATLRCRNCQNWEISQKSPDSIPHLELFPAQVVASAAREGCQSVAFTYTEPTVFFEYALETAKLARAAGLKNLLISNGYLEEQPLQELAKVTDAANIDLKAFSEETYKTLFGGSLQPVLRTLEVLKEEGVWLEITNLLIPGITDRPEMIARMCGWLATHGFSGTPLHFSRFHPMYKMGGVPATPLSSLVKAREIALKEGIRFVYLGNVPGADSENTICPGCNALLVRRSGFIVMGNRICRWRCPECGTAIEGRWNE